MCTAEATPHAAKRRVPSLLVTSKMISRFRGAGSVALAQVW